jgi:hypothetical protein
MSMTDFIAAYEAEIMAALDDQGREMAAARDKFNERAHAAEIALLAAMAHRGRLYISGPPAVEPEPEKPEFPGERDHGFDDDSQNALDGEA